MKFENEDILSEIYENKAEELDKITQEEIQKIKEENRETFENENIEEIYHIKMSKLMKEFYKKGFKDGVNLILECLK